MSDREECVRVTQKRLKELLSFDPDTGVFTWLIHPGKKIKRGDVAGSKNRNGYIYVQAEGIRYRAHRLAWFYVYGEWPQKEVDHINGIKNDNRIANLRLVTHSENQCNRTKQVNNTSGFKGVYWHKKSRKWMTRIWVDGKCKYLGLFDSREEASCTYVAASNELHGEFCRLEKASYNKTKKETYEHATARN